MLCGARTRNSEYCLKPALKGRTRCRNHGGLSPSAANHWNFRHGKETKVARERARLIAVELKLCELILMASDDD
jgi:hypothetical protein